MDRLLVYLVKVVTMTVSETCKLTALLAFPIGIGNKVNKLYVIIVCANHTETSSIQWRIMRARGSQQNDKLRHLYAMSG